jgi:hypothetical protein
MAIGHPLFWFQLEEMMRLVAKRLRRTKPLLLHMLIDRQMLFRWRWKLEAFVRPEGCS